MTIKFSDVVSKTDWAKIIILVVISTICWVWVWTEYQKPIIPPEWEKELMAQNIDQQRERD